MKPIRVALIPAYQPDDILIALVRELALHDFFLIVVDDGSGEDFAPLMEEVSGNAVVLTHEEKKGRSAALRTGLAYLKAHFPFSYTVVTMDADGKHRICDAEHLCLTAEEQRDALVIGTRLFPKKTPLRTKLGNRMQCLGLKLSTGVSVRDAESGLLACSDAFAAKLMEHFGDDPAALLRACAKAHIPMPQVNIRNQDGNLL